MDAPGLLVSTKFAPPRIGARLIPRQQLLEHLREARRCALVLVTASGGFGKTIVLAQWRQELMKAGATVSWLSLGPDDSGIEGFSRYLLSALTRLGLHLEAHALVEGDGARATEAAVAMVVNAAAGVNRQLVLFVDDYHHVEDPAAHRLMQRLLDHCPGNLHFVVASRVTPPWTLSRLRVAGQVAEVGMEELPFSPDETRVYFEQALGSVRLSADEVRLIHDQTSGWPATLHLLAIVLRSRPSTRQRLRDLGLRSPDLQRDLAEDIVAHLPADLTAFLESVSICRRFNADLASAVSGCPEAAELIRRAEDENLLLYRAESGDALSWFRFHPLFGEFLAERLARRGGDAMTRRLHRRASAWFAGRGLLAEAVRHAILAEDLESAVEVIEHAAPDTWGLATISPMLSLLERLPQATLFAHPQLFFIGCLTFSMTARHAHAEQWMRRIRDSPAACNPAIALRLPLVDAAIALQQDDSLRVIELLEHLPSAACETRFLKYVWLTTLVAACANAGRCAQAHRLLDEYPVPLEDRRNDMAMVVELTRVGTLLTEGRAEEAARIGAALLARSESEHGRHSVCANLCAAHLGNAYYELDLIDDAREVLANRRGVLQVSMPSVMVFAALARARLDHLQESTDAALGLLSSHGAHYRRIGLDRPAAHMLAERVRMLIEKGERAAVPALIAELDALAGGTPDAPGAAAEIRAMAALARARAALGEADAKNALACLSHVQAYAEQHGRWAVCALAWLLSALALEDLGRQDEALESARRSVELGRRLGLIRTFVDEGPRAGVVLARLREEGDLDAVASQYLVGLLQRMKSARGPVPAEAGPHPPGASTQAVSLTPREVEILKLIAQAMSNKRIALTLNVTLETVKWNVRNILAKLGVSSRYDAMTWTRKRGLIE